MPQNIMYIGEFGNDPDEESSLLFLLGLVRLKLVKLLAVIANRSPAIMRARLAKGTLEMLGFPQIPVIQGTDCGQHRQEDDRIQFAATYLSDAPEFPKLDAFWDLLSQAQDHSVALVCASGLTDIALLLARNTTHSKERLRLFKQKIARVSIMGGVVNDQNQILLDEDGRVMPSWDATNNQHDRIAEYVYTQLQRMEIELIVVTKQAAYAAPVPREMYRNLARRHHPVGVRLERIQKGMIQHLWWRCNLPPESPARDGLPPELGTQWFSNAFCRGKNLSNIKPTDEIWEYVEVFNLYDPMAVMAAIPEISGQHFDPILINGGKVQVIGMNRQYHQVSKPAKTAGFLEAGMLRGLLK
ncbi:nucleoside hydrolase [Candidatus Uhrbacteria bacterium]|nr:nucleoside hydrolase [Candidatus Uhrbacteria bacterium]